MNADDFEMMISELETAVEFIEENYDDINGDNFARVRELAVHLYNVTGRV